MTPQNQPKIDGNRLILSISTEIQEARVGGSNGTWMRKYVTQYHKPVIKLAPDQFNFIANLET